MGERESIKKTEGVVYSRCDTCTFMAYTLYLLKNKDLERAKNDLQKKHTSLYPECSGKLDFDLEE